MNKKGFSLIEIVIAIGVFSIAAVSVALIFKLTVSSSANPGTRMQATLISESLMDEILSKSFYKPNEGFVGPFNNENRNKFDTITDYNGLSIIGVKNSNNVAISGLDNYSFNIKIEGKSIGNIDEVDSYLVTIDVTGPNDNFTLKGFSLNKDE